MSAVASRSRARRCAASAWATSSSPRPVTHIWYFKGVPSRLGYLLDIAPKSLEKVIYFAAHMITWVDDERRHKDLAAARGRHPRRDRRRGEASASSSSASATRSTRPSSRSSRSATRKKNELERAEKARNKDFEEIRARADAEIEFLKTVWDTFRVSRRSSSSTTSGCGASSRTATRSTSPGGMGAEAIKDLISRIDMEAEEAVPQGDHRSPPRASARRRRSSGSRSSRRSTASTTTAARSTRRWAWCSTRSR